MAGAAAEPTSLAGALADSLEGVAAEACAAGARVGVWTCGAGISARSGGRGLIIRAAAPGQGREAGSMAGLSPRPRVGAPQGPAAPCGASAQRQHHDRNVPCKVAAGGSYLHRTGASPI